MKFLKKKSKKLNFKAKKGDKDSWNRSSGTPISPKISSLAFFGLLSSKAFQKVHIVKIMML